MLLLKRLSLFPLLVFILGWLPLNAHAQWFGSSSSQDEFLPVMEAFQPTAWHDGERLFIGIDIADEYYLYRHQLAVSSQTERVSLGEPSLPKGTFTNDEFMGDVYIFRDQVVFEVPLKAPYSGPLNITLTFQGCADAGLCYPPEQTNLQASETQPPSQFANWDTANSTATDEVANATQSAFTAPQSEDSRFSALISDTSLPLALGLFFIAGLGLTFTPCVLPMIPILSSMVVGQNPTRPRAFALSLSYVLGMALTYALVGVLMGLFGAGLNLQARLQSAPVLFTFAVLFTLFALAMFGVFNLNLSPRLANRIDAWQARAQRSGPAGLAVAGALSVLVVSPCVTAPLAGALVFISSTGDAVIGGTALLALALGMGVPLLLVGTFGATLLPRSGAWMNGVKIAFGLLLLGVAIWMIERLVAAPVALLLWAALAIGTALVLGALNFNQPQGWPRARQTLGIMLLAWGVVLVIGAAQGNNNPLRPLAATASFPGQSQSEALDFIEIDNLIALEKAIAEADSVNQPVFVHFTADWCISCKLLERDVYPDPRVTATLNDYTLIAADVTHTDSQSRQLLEKFNLFGPPSLLFFSQGEEIRNARIQGEVTADQLLEHLESVSRWLASS
ncbi:thiol:disulfide interchange protein [Vreelandella sulfidaeris]|uniref:Thiol:disulfide interchange protein DsbD n=1 Tax=Vreelandella sulfidaeris TaxID=115553 RepID=A0A365TTW9_9GAMM|nr:protein-disulfide reductase DsbD [Halomonas sulfidaeris]RBI69317.1 thiol:disulfide interchange protein [Halomonas sulfidaeris]